MGIKASIPIELVSTDAWTDQHTTTYRAFRVHLDPADFNGLAGARFEVCGEVITENTEPILVDLVDEDGTVYATVPLLPVAGAAETQMVRGETTWTFAAAHWYTIRLHPGQTSEFVDVALWFVNMGRIWLDLENSTKMAVQRPMIDAAESSPGYGDTTLENENNAFSLPLGNFSGTMAAYGYSQGLFGIPYNKDWENSIFKKDDSKWATITTWRLAVTAWARTGFSFNPTTHLGDLSGEGKIALFNKTTGLMVGGTEQTWPYQEMTWENDGARYWVIPQTKVIEFANDAENFTDLDDFEVRFASTLAGDTNTFVMSRVDLWAVLNPVTKARISIVIGRGSENWGFSNTITKVDKAKYGTDTAWSLEAIGRTTDALTASDRALISAAFEPEDEHRYTVIPIEEPPQQFLRDLGHADYIEDLS